MSDLLSVSRFVTRCRVPRGLGLDPARMDRLARGPVAAAFAREADGLGGAGVVRVRRLAVRLAVAPGDLDESRLPALWAAAFARTLREAIARGGTPGSEVVRAPDRAEWLARWIAAATGGLAAGRWEYEEFAHLAPLGPGPAAAAALLAEPGEIAGVLASLDAANALDRLLALLDEEALERLTAAATAAAGVAESASAVGDLFTVARALAAGLVPRPAGELPDRRLALRLFARLRREPGGLAPATPRRVLHALAALSCLLAIPVAGGSLLDALARHGGPIDRFAPGASHPAVIALLSALREAVRRSGAGRLAGPLVEFAASVESLAVLRPTAAARWVSSDVAGLFLLVESLGRLGWPARWLSGPLGRVHGARVMAPMLAGLGLAVLGRFPDALRWLDPGIALFAGIFGDPDSAGLLRFFEARNPDGEAGPTTSADRLAAWAAELDALAGVLVRSFAAQVAGFRGAGREFIIAQLIARPGRVLVEEGRITVRLAPSPLHVALHVSGMDYPVGPVDWYGGRSVAFELEGL
jgi:hypothetical protein